MGNFLSGVRCGDWCVSADDVCSEITLEVKPFYVRSTVVGRAVSDVTDYRKKN